MFAEGNGLLRSGTIGECIWPISIWRFERTSRSEFSVGTIRRGCRTTFVPANPPLRHELEAMGEVFLLAMDPPYRDVNPRPRLEGYSSSPPSGPFPIIGVAVAIPADNHGLLHVTDGEHGGGYSLTASRITTLQYRSLSGSTRSSSSSCPPPSFLRFMLEAADGL